MTTNIDMAQFISPKSDQLNSDDLIGGPITIRVTNVSANEGSPEQPININFEGDDRKPYKPCKSMRRVMVHCWGADAKAYVGRSMTIYRDPEVQFGGMKVGGIRISHMSHIDGKKTMALTATRAKRAPYTVLPLSDSPKQSAKEDRAAKWTESYIGQIDACPNMDALMALENKFTERLSELKEKRPELHERIIHASQARASALSAEKRSDDEMGEGFAATGSSGDIWD